MRNPAYLVVTLLVLGCDPDGGPGDDPTDFDTEAFAPGAPPPPVLLRGMHLSPDRATGCDLDGDPETTDDQYAACVALFIGSGFTPIASDAFPFGASSGFLPVPVTGIHTFHAVDWNAWQGSAGQGNVPENRVASFSVGLFPGTTHTAVIYGSTQLGNTGVRVVPEDLAPPPDGEALLRVFHGAFGASAASPGVALDGEPVVDAVPYGQFSASYEVVAGVGRVLTLDLDGDEQADLIAQITLEADTTYDLMLVNVPPTTVPSGFLGMLHTTTSQQPTLVPFGPFPPT